MTPIIPERHSNEKSVLIENTAPVTNFKSEPNAKVFRRPIRSAYTVSIIVIKRSPAIIKESIRPMSLSERLIYFRYIIRGTASDP